LVTDDRRVVFLDMESGLEIGILQSDVTTTIRTLSFSDDGRRLVFGKADGQVELWRPNRLQPDASWKAEKPINSIHCIGPTNILIAGRELQFWDCVHQRKEFSWPVKNGPVEETLFDSSTQELVFMTRNQQVHSYQLSNLHKTFGQLHLEIPELSRLEQPISGPVSSMLWRKSAQEHESIDR